ncbi:MAG: alpha/beta hydrolase [Polyangiaceae bacterium]|nr:alpha/beta hydrolase [Polyangiaceae bacterium]
MLPVYFGSPDVCLFGSYHSPTLPARRVAVLILNPLGHEQVHSYRVLRCLAESLADKGFATLRFDLEGTGDSSGDDRTPGRLAAWQKSISDAAIELKKRSGVERLAIVGLRLGALLALHAAPACSAEHAVLWMPVTSGKAHGRELLRLHKMLMPKVRPENAPAEDEEALGFALRKDTVNDLAKLDPNTLSEKPVTGCLVVGGHDNPAEDKLLEKLQSLGVVTEYKHLPGHPFLVTDPHKNEVPSEVIDHIAGHLTSVFPDRDGPGLPTQLGGVIEGGPHREEAWLFGEPYQRFGILTRPATPSDKPALVFMNAGSVHHIGPGRAFVRMARKIADLGYPVFRMDLSGIGESPVAPNAVSNVPYPPNATLDAQAAMTALEQAGVAKKFILTGLCSGADIAFRAAVIDERVVGAWMINPQAFYFPSSDALKEFMHAELQAQYYKGAVWDLDRWKKMFRGETDVMRIARIMRGKVESALKRRLSRALGDSLPTAKNSPEARDVIADLELTARRTRDAFLLCSEDDPGLVYLLNYFDKGLEKLEAVPGFQKQVIAHVDHTFTPLWAQDLLSDTLIEHLRQKHG